MEKITGPAFAPASALSVTDERHELFRASVIIAALLAVSLPASSDPAIHYAPAENLEHIDVELIDTAKREIDFAAYVLTDWPVIQALARAANHGVKVRIYLDGGQLGERDPRKSSMNSPLRPALRSAPSEATARLCTSRATRLTTGCSEQVGQTSQLPD